MREILFRGKQEEYPREWIEGMFTIRKFAGKEYHAIERRERRIITYDYEWTMQPYKVIPETIGQYTGKKDKNGKRIFEGDIFECYADYDDSLGYTQTSSFLAVVVWDEKHFCWGMKVNDEIQDFSDWTWENSFLVGNIHDNPELLKGE